MGKLALLLVIAVTLGGGAMLYQSSSITRSTDANQAGFQEEEVVREITRSAYNSALAKVQQQAITGQIDAARDSVKNLNAKRAYQGGYFWADANYVSGQPYLDIEAYGEYASANTEVAGNKQHVIKARLTLNSILESAVSLVADGANVDLDDTFSINGVNHNAVTGATSDLGLLTYGVAAKSGSRADFWAAMEAGNHESQIWGRTSGSETPGTQSILEEDESAFVQDLINDALQHADQTLGSLQILDGVSQTYGTTHNPQITVVNGDITIEPGGSLTGSGMLVIGGDFQNLGGRFEWDGIVLASDPNSSVTFNFYGDSRIDGALILQSDVSDCGGDLVVCEDSRLRVNYLASYAWYCSAVYYEPINPDGTTGPAVELFPSGGNRFGDLFEEYDEIIPAGTQMNFFIRVDTDHGGAGDGQCYGGNGTYDLYALNPTGETGQLEEARHGMLDTHISSPYTWRVSWEDQTRFTDAEHDGVRDGFYGLLGWTEYSQWDALINPLTGYREIWDAGDIPDFSDQIIEIELLQADGTPYDPNAVLGGNAAPIHLTMTGDDTDPNLAPEVNYSYDAIVPLARKLATIRDLMQFDVKITEQATCSPTTSPNYPACLEDAAGGVGG